MEFLRSSWAQAKTFLGQLSVSARWLIGCLAIIFILTGWLLVQYAASPDMVPITRFTAQSHPQVIAQLRGAGINVSTEGGQVAVPADRYNDAMVILASGDMLATDTTAAFDELIARQSPWHSNAQNARAFLLAKQKVLGQIIASMGGVRTASVMLSTPQNQGFGATFVRPSASVNVVMGSSRRVDKVLVAAIAGLVSGAMAEMQPQDVVVIDANRGRQFTVKSQDGVLPDESLELVGHLEQRYREKITELLGYIPNVIVAVNVRVDPMHSKRVEQFDYENSEPLKSEFTRETQRQETNNAGEPGARPNTGLDIASGSGGSSESTAETRNEFGDKNLTRRTHTMEIGHTTKQINVTINIPRRYFVGVFKQGKTDEENQEEPDDAALAPIIQAQLAQIEEQVKPIVSTQDDTSIVRAHMVPDPDQLMVLAGLAGSAGGSGAMGMLTDSTWAKPVGLGLLALASLGIMFGMARKASQHPELPSIEELAGIPGKLPTEEELVSEADETEAPMEGVEVGEEDMHVHKLSEQISDLVKADPHDAGAMFGRWAAQDD